MIKNSIEMYRGASISVTLDGPPGLYHEPKDFPFIAELLLGKRVLPILLEFSIKIQLKKRWDKYTIPLPFNKIKLRTHLPLEITKEDKKICFLILKNKFYMKWKMTVNFFMHYFYGLGDFGNLSLNTPVLSNTSSIPYQSTPPSRQFTSLSSMYMSAQTLFEVVIPSPSIFSFTL